MVVRRTGEISRVFHSEIVPFYCGKLHLSNYKYCEMWCDVLIISSSDRRSENSGNIVTGEHRLIRGTVSHLWTGTI